MGNMESRFFRLICIFLFCVLFYEVVRSPLYAATSTVTTRSDFDAGVMNGTETASSVDNLKLKGDGVWNARSWRSPELTLTDGTTFATDGTHNYLIIGRDVLFKKYIPSEDTWKNLAEAPHMPSSGADMVVLGNYVYTSFGGYQKEFSRYSIVNNTWEDLTDLPDLVNSGSSLQTDGTYVYAMRGAATTDFWRYNPSTGTWITLTGPPATINTGADLIFDNSLGTDYLYTPRGGNTTTFYRYDISGGTWSTVSAAPGTLNDNGNITKRGNYIYTLRGGNTTTFYRYSISGDSWTTISATPAATRYVGLTYNAYEDLIYVFRGNSTYDWWKYDADDGSFAGPTDLPVTPGTGADLVYYNSKVYYRRGSNTTTFYSYDPSVDSYTSLTAAPATFNDDSKGVVAGAKIYYLRAGNTTSFYSYDVAGNSWSTLSSTPANARYGSSLAYPGSGNYIYGTRGAQTTAFWRYSISGDTWDDAGAADMPAESESSYGARIVSDGTDVYAITGQSIARLLKYSVSGDSWSVLGNLPFAPYYGTDIVYYNGKIYAVAGYYKTSLWEYTISTNTWRRLPDMAGYYANNIGPYNGGSISSNGSGTFYIINGGGLSRMLTFTASVYNYPVSGTWTSDVMDLTYVSSFTNLASSETTPDDSVISYETRTSSDKATWSSWTSVSSGTISSSANRYLQIRSTLAASSDRTQTPTLSSVTVNYSGDTTAPSNPSSITGASQAVGGSALTNGASYAYTAPYFSWSGASDGQTSVDGYYVYFGTSASGDPQTAGSYQTGSTYTVTAALSTGTYYLRIQTKDAIGNISAATTLFTYVYNGVSPAQSTSATLTSDFSSGTSSNVSTSGDEVKLSSKAGFWQQDRLSTIPASVNYGASMAYVSSSGKLYTARGNSTTFYSYDIATDTWSTLSAAPSTVYRGGDTIEGPNGYLYAISGENTNTFMRYAIDSDSWDDAAASDAPGPFYYGASLIYDGSQYIYALKGNSDDSFYRYDTSGNTWDSMANTDFGSPTTQPNNNVYIGGDLAFDGDNTLYAIQGNQNSGFASYSISDDSWTVLGNLPVLPYNGSQIAYDSETNAIYYISGWSNPFMYKYSISSQTWTKLPDAPAAFGNGSSLRNVDGVLYVIRGNGTSFWRFNIEKNSWKVPNYGLFGPEFRGTDYRPFGYGAQIVKGDGNHYYLTRGNYDSQFVRYDSSTGEAVTMTDVPTGFYIGSAITYDSTNNQIYAIGSQYDPFMYVYDVSTDTWSQLSSDGLPADPSTGSSLEYDGTRYLYWLRGGSTSFYRYDTQASAGSRWSAMTNVTASIGYGGHLVYNGGYLYTARGNNTTTFYRYDVSGNSWSTLTAVPATVYNDGFLVDGDSSTLYLCRGGNQYACYSYDIASDSWSSIADAPANIYQGGAGASNASNKMYVIAGASGTNTYTNGLYSYIMQTATSSFEESGDFASATHDLTSVYKFANISITKTTAASNTSLLVYTRSSSDDSSWSSWVQATEEKQVGTNFEYSINSAANRYIQVKLAFTSGDGILSDVVSDYTISYYQDVTAPSNPTSLTVYNSATQSATLTTDTWYNHSAPQFVWPVAEDTGGASDGSGGSGVSGYYVYFGTDNSADPQSDGSLQSGATYTASSLSSGSTYYLRIKTVDAAANAVSSTWQPFVYKFDSTEPSNPSTLVADPSGYTNSNNFDFSWSGSSDSGSGISSYCYKTGASGATDTCTASTSISGVTAYQTGTNTFYVRAKDTANNVTSSYATVSYYYSATAPSAPTDVEVSPSSNTVNEFAFSWSPPDVYSGSQSGLRYYYSVNAVPTAQNVNTVGLSNTYLTADSYATVPGDNIFYVVAKDEAGNIDYNTYASVTFTADTSAPGVARNLDIADVSIKATESWKLALSWDAPVASGSGVATYKVYHSTTDDAVCSTGFTDFTFLASTTGKSYVDSDLAQDTHYYCVKACDSTNNCSAVSDTVSLYPDGKWTSAASLSNDPSVSVKTKSATVNWATSRTSNSFVKYGTASGDYGEEVGSSDQVTSHEIDITGLNPGTTYYYKVLWTDEDGNTGESDELTFETDPAPFISKVSAKNISITTAYIEFTVKNAVAVKVQYGETDKYGNLETLSTSKSETTHLVPLSELTEGTLYHFRITAQDNESNEFSGDDYTFETLPVPRIANVKVQQVVGFPTATVRLLWSSNTPVSSVVTYLPSEFPERARDQIFLQLKQNHEVILKDLLDETSYRILVKGKDAAGNEATADPVVITTASDLREPLIVNAAVEASITGVGEAARAQINITWDTDEPGTTQVEYGEGTGSTYSQSTKEDPLLTSNHGITIPGLQPNKIYHLRVVSKDKAGNSGVSEDIVIITPRATRDALNLVVEKLSKTFGFLKNFNFNQ